MHTVDPALLTTLIRRYGEPCVQHWTAPVGADELAMVRASRRGWRSHDVTFFIFAPDGRLALIRKPFHPPGVWRAPSGGIEPEEEFEAGTLREAEEETGLSIRLERYVARIHVNLTAPDGSEPWITHIFTAASSGGPLDPRDLEEIAAARWADLAELQGPIRAALLASGRGLLAYRARLTDLTLDLLAGKPCPHGPTLAE